MTAIALSVFLTDGSKQANQKGRGSHLPDVRDIVHAQH
jgi:hypothetical protein